MTNYKVTAKIETKYFEVSVPKSTMRSCRGLEGRVKSKLEDMSDEELGELVRIGLLMDEFEVSGYYEAD